MEFFSRVVINATDDIYPEELLDTSIMAGWQKEEVYNVSMSRLWA